MFECSQTSFDQSFPLSCNLSVVFSCPSAQVGIHYGDGTSDTHETAAATGVFGLPVPSNLTSDQYVAPTTGSYLVVNAEITEDSVMTAIEFYMATAGSIGFYVDEFFFLKPLVFF